MRTFKQPSYKSESEMLDAVRRDAEIEDEWRKWNENRVDIEMMEAAHEKRLRPYLTNPIEWWQNPYRKVF